MLHKQAHQQHFEGMALVARSLEEVTQLAQLLGGPDIDGSLGAEGSGLIAGDEAEQLHMFVKVGKVEVML